jgi:hypothetical protein
VGTGDLVSLLENLEDDGCATERDEEAEKNPLGAALPEEREGRDHRPEGHPHLEQAAQQDRSLHLDELLEGELDADGEKEKNDPDLGKDLHSLHSTHEAQSVRSGEQPGKQEPNDARHPQAVTDQKHRDR